MSFAAQSIGGVAVYDEGPKIGAGLAADVPHNYRLSSG